jgi:hypothetical protein
LLVVYIPTTVTSRTAVHHHFLVSTGCSLKLGTWKGSCLLGPKPVTCMVGVSSFLYPAIAGTPSSLPRLFIINHSHSISGDKLASC